MLGAWVLVGAVIATMLFVALGLREPPLPNDGAVATADLPAAKPAEVVQHVPSPARRNATPSMLRVLDAQGDPVAATLTFLAAGKLERRECPPGGVTTPPAFTDVLVEQPDWMPVCVPVTAIECPSDGPRVLRLPPPMLTARVVAPPDAGPLRLFAEVDMAPIVSIWPALVREHVLAQGFVGQPGRLSLREGREISCGGLPSGTFALATDSKLVFRATDGSIADRWRRELPVTDAVVELTHAPTLRITPRFASSATTERLTLTCDQLDATWQSLGGHDAPANADTPVAFQRLGDARMARLTLRATDTQRLLATADVRLSMRDQDEELWVGLHPLAITVVDERDTPIADACVVEQEELLGVTDARGMVELLAVGHGPIEAVARGHGCSSVSVAELRATQRIVLPPPTTLVVDARKAALALGGGTVTLRGGFVAPCSSRAGDRLIREWNEREPSSSMGSGINDSRVMLDELRYAADPEHPMTFVGLFEPGHEMTVVLSDRNDAETGVSKRVRFERGERKVVELPVPNVVRFSGRIVSAADGTPILSAQIANNGMWGFLAAPMNASEGWLDLTAAAGRAITITAYGFTPRTFEASPPDGLFRLQPARELRIRIVDADGSAIACDYELRSAEHGFSVTGRHVSKTGVLCVEEVPSAALELQVRRAAEIRTFRVPADTKEWTATWR